MYIKEVSHCLMEVLSVPTSQQTVVSRVGGVSVVACLFSWHSSHTVNRIMPPKLLVPKLVQTTIHPHKL